MAVPMHRPCNTPGCERVTALDRGLCRACESTLLDRAFGPSDVLIADRIERYVGRPYALSRAGVPIAER